MPTLKTIGVYGFDRESFLAALADARVDLLLDVRQRRGVRGSEYAWANAQGEGKRSRTVLAPAYVERYSEEVLDRVDLAPVVKWIGNSAPALLCVERDPEACHRSLVAERLSREFGFEVEHLRP